MSERVILDDYLEAKTRELEEVEQQQSDKELQKRNDEEVKIHKIRLFKKHQDLEVSYESGTEE